MDRLYRHGPIMHHSPVEACSGAFLGPDTLGMDADDRPPICPRCGVTMVPAALSADDEHEGDWVCLECEELTEDG
jgi:hypothetical protein